VNLYVVLPALVTDLIAEGRLDIEIQISEDERQRFNQVRLARSVLANQDGVGRLLVEIDFQIA